MKKIIIVGASSGIGLALAETLASRGVRVGLAARHTRVLSALKQKYDGLVEYLAIDVTHRTAPERLRELIDKVGGMDIYFHIAGIGYENLTLDPDRETAIVETNATGFARMIDAAYRYFAANEIRGHITAVTSVAGTKGIGRLSAYSASKAFGQAYIVALRQLAQMERTGITLTDIRPGWTRTPLLRDDAVYPMTMDVDRVVLEILRATVRRRTVATVDWRWDILSRLWRLLPDALWVRLPVEISLPDKALPEPPATETN
ncbi:MAG: SDR family NAD(P)-dependent oxidoreductase [Clostridium sp.]|nr:SDR family NAD(P)-dependent oxidoreductase [Clostridium sp.]